MNAVPPAVVLERRFADTEGEISLMKHRKSADHSAGSFVRR